MIFNKLEISDKEGLIEGEGHEPQSKFIFKGQILENRKFTGKKVYTENAELKNEDKTKSYDGGYTLYHGDHDRDN